MPLIEIVEDLSWLAKVWQQEGEPAMPYSVTWDHKPALLVLGDDGIMVHRGTTRFVQMSTPEVRQWWGAYFIPAIRRSTYLRDVRLGALRKWSDVQTDDGPCLACGARGVIFADDGSPRFCPHCILGRVRKPIWGRIGAELVNLRAILGPLGHLRGDLAHFYLFDGEAPAFATEQWALIVEPARETPDQVAATPFD